MIGEKTRLAASLRALLAATVDYAGLFPPATLALEPALGNYAEYLRSDDAWMLGAFVLPVEQFSAAEGHLDLFSSSHALRISALGKRSESADSFSGTLAGYARMMAEWTGKHRGRVIVPQLEMPLPPEFDDSIFVAARSLVEPLKLQAFWEAPADRAEEAIATLARHNASHPSRPFGYKLRTGGTSADAFPKSVQIARALVAATKSKVPIKFTAGLHHPVRLFHDSVQTKMHGFLNVLGAGIFASEAGWGIEQTTQMLEDEDAHCFGFTDGCMTWRNQVVPTERIAAHRALITSFGSCSFDEPREDLRALNLL
ncbi:MAG: hypothetical protein ACJ8KU_03560 [Chthoniobacterales bacterium]